MTISNILTTLSRLSLHTLQQPITRPISTTNIHSPLYFKATNVLLGEPLKKKKRVDPQVLAHRYQRKKKKIEREIRRLEKHAKQTKPINELMVSKKLLNELEIKARKNEEIPENILESRILLEKKWNHYKQKQHLRDLNIIDSILSSQKRALDELKLESDSLYQAAINANESPLLPYVSDMPAIVNTPPIIDYPLLDGEYKNITLKYEGEK